MRKLYLIIFMFIVLCYSGVAQDNLGTFKSGSCIQLIQTCSNCTFINFTSVYSPTMELLQKNIVATKDGTNYNINFCNTTLIGKYIVNTIGDIDGTITTQTPYFFYISKTGGNIIENNNAIFIWLLFLITILGSFYYLFLGIAKLATQTETIYGVLSSWAFILLTLIINYMAQDMVGTFIYDQSIFILQITAWTNGVLPLIGLIITIMIKGLKKNKPIGIEELGGFK